MTNPYKKEKSGGNFSLIGTWLTARPISNHVAVAEEKNNAMRGVPGCFLLRYVVLCLSTLVQNLMI